MRKIGILVFMAFLLMATVSAYTMTRSVPSSAAASSTFTVTYQVPESGTWGASIVDNVAGGCTFPGGATQLKTVMLSVDGNSKSITVTSPSGGSCTFTGDYKFGEDSAVNFPSATVTFGGSCTPNCACASSTCTGQTCSNGCGGTCAGTKTCSSGDTGTCSAVFSDTLNIIGFTDNSCTNGYIMAAIIAIVGLIVLTRFIK